MCLYLEAATQALPAFPFELQNVLEPHMGEAVLTTWKVAA